MKSAAPTETSISVVRFRDEPRTPDVGARQRLVVAGFGMVGHKLIERLVELDALERYAVTVIGEEPYQAYDRVRLTELLDHGDSTRLELAAPGWYDEHGVGVITGSPVVSIDRANCTVKTAAGEHIAYDRLVLATGSAPLVPPIAGAGQDGVFVYRTIEDLDRIRRRAAEVRSAVIVGGGLLGIEAAHALLRLGLFVTVVETAPYLMSRQLDAYGAALLETKICEMGVRTIAGVRPLRIGRRGDAFTLEIEGHDASLEGGMIVLAAGVRPRDELARHSGLAIGSGRGGVVVDDMLRTPDPAIYAIGECAWHNGAIYGLAAPGYRMAETLAEILSGRASRFPGFEPAVRLKLMGVEVTALGDHAEPGSQASWQVDGGYRQITLKAGRLVGASAVGVWPDIAFTHELIRERRRIWPWQLRRFRKTGSFARKPTRRPVARWPEAAVVCNCMSVTRGALSDARTDGCASAEDLARRTGASTVCGSCRPLLAELACDVAATAALKGRGALLACAAGAALLALSIVAVPPIPLAESVQRSDVWGLLYRDGWWRQATGFGLLGCSLAAAALSLRKRWKLARFGDFDWWRLAHGAIGAAALCTLVAHTGLRLGSGFNQVLMIAFLGANVVGAAAAAGVGRRGARWTFWLHLIAVWPLPVLIGFHIFSVYYF